MTQFYQHYRSALLAAIWRIVRNQQSAEDILQESMMKIWQSIATYDAAQSRFFTWAARICCNTAIDHVRTSRFRVTARTASLEGNPHLATMVASGFQPEHIGVPELLLRLRPEHRRVMDLLYLQGYTQAEAADELQVPLGTVKSWVSCARYFLAKQT